MDPVQTTVTEKPDRAIAGMWADNSSIKEVISRQAESGIMFGRVVVDGTTAAQVKPPVTAASLLGKNVISGGVALFQHYTELGDTYDYAEDSAVPVVRKGRVWMPSETALARGAHPFVRHVATGLEVLGTLRNDADTSDATQCFWIRVLETLSAAGLALCEIDLPHADVMAELTAGASNDQVLKWNSTSGAWEPGTDAT